MPIATELSKSGTGEACAATGYSGWLTPERVRLYAATLFFLECLMVVAWWYGRTVIANPTIPTMGWDFVVYWNASGLAQAHGAAAAYDWELLRAAESQLLPNTFSPFAYPPTYLLLIYPLGALPFGVAMLMFSLAGLALYLCFVHRALDNTYRLWLFPALAFPGIWTAFLAGQNSLFTVAAAGAALLLMRRHALAAGACIALLCVKPQLGLLFPLLLLCERRWAVIIAAAAFSALFLAVTALAFGIDIFSTSAASIAKFRGTVTEHAGVLRGAPTTFALLYVAGIEASLAYAVHAVVALGVAATCMWLWWQRPRLALSASALAVGTLLSQPYLIYYDLAWLAIPLALLAADLARHGSQRWERMLLGAAWLVPAQAMLAVRAEGMVQVTPLILLGLLVLIVRRRRLQGLPPQLN